MVLGYFEEEKVYDFIVVGGSYHAVFNEKAYAEEHTGGTAGNCVAGRLAENPNLSILVIEAGTEFVLYPHAASHILSDIAILSRKRKSRLQLLRSNSSKANTTGSTPSLSGTEMEKRDMKLRIQEAKSWVEAVV